MPRVVSLPREVRSIVDPVVAFAAEAKLELYIVGGLVRDTLLERSTRDIDFVWIGAVEPERARRALGDRLGEPGTFHPSFGTAVFELGDWRIDFARARSEHYPAPAALPQIKPAGLDADLFRRDFSVNTLAVRLDGLDSAGYKDLQVIDRFNGLGDLGARVVRVLHDQSLVDDPTRIFRALELAERCQMSLEPATLELARDSIREGHVGRLSGVRVRHELERLLRRPQGLAGAAKRLRDLALESTLVEGLRIDRAAETRLTALAARPAEELADIGSGLWSVALAVIFWFASDEARAALAQRLELARSDRRLLTETPARVRLLLEDTTAVDSAYPGRRRPSLTPAAWLVAELCVDPAVRERLVEARISLELKLTITGADLVSRHSESPEIGAALAATRRARFEGRIQSKDELDFALTWLADRGGGT